MKTPGMGETSPEKKEKKHYVIDDDLLEKYLGHPVGKRCYLSAVGEFIEKEAKKQGVDVEFSAPQGYSAPKDYYDYESPDPVSDFPVELLRDAYNRFDAMRVQANEFGLELMSNYGDDGCCMIFKQEEYGGYVDDGMPKNDHRMNYFKSWEEAEKWLLDKKNKLPKK